MSNTSDDTPQMDITLLRENGEEKQLEDVEKFSWSHSGDEAVVMVTFADGSGDTYTGRRLAVNGGEITV